MTELLREELGFTGLIVTDGIEMRAISDRFGLEHATVLALVAGNDAICIGGDHADEPTAIRLRDAIVAAVCRGELSEERLADAAARVERIAQVAHQTPPRPRTGERSGLDAARQAIRVTGPERTLPTAQVIEFQPVLSFAIAPETPWGVGAPLADLLPGTTWTRVVENEPVPALDGRPLVLVVRDAHRYPWVLDAVGDLLAVRPDAIVVEMGIPMAVLGATHLATYGATTVAGRAAAERLARRP
jgi:beta-N-acetylhexosaminidase